MQRGHDSALWADKLLWTRENRTVPSLEEEETHQYAEKNSNLCPRFSPALTEVEDRSGCGGPSDHRLSIRRHLVSCNNPPQAWGLSGDQKPRREQVRITKPPSFSARPPERLLGTLAVPDPAPEPRPGTVIIIIAAASIY